MFIVCMYVCAVKSESDDSSETESGEEYQDIVKPSVRHFVKKRDRKPSSASTVTMHKVFTSLLVLGTTCTPCLSSLTGCPQHSLEWGIMFPLCLSCCLSGASIKLCRLWPALLHFYILYHVLLHA